MNVIALCLVLALTLTGGPLEFGSAELENALRDVGLTIDTIEAGIDGTGAPESYDIRFEGGKAFIRGADASGVMYGALELAERVKAKGRNAFDGETITGRPFLKQRGLNIFLTLPWDYEKNNTCYDPQALVDPQRWWFQNEDYWRSLLDSMARSRLNWLDLHGMWDVSVTNAPNLYAYFIQSEKYPQIGVAPKIKAANLQQLNHIIEMAKNRGIQVSLMAYEARITIPHNPKPAYEQTEKLAYDYTREMVEKMIRQAPGLHTIGFRIGESGRGGDFFNCYLEAVKNSGRDIPLFTRSWVTTKAKVVPLARKSSDFTVEIKYNGEQWGAPYPIAGGRAAGWYSYSFEDYLSDSSREGAVKLWPGHGDWPHEPYKIAWQVRANGTHRIFPFYEPGWVRRSVKAMRIGTAVGFTVEPLNAYYPASPRYYMADKNDLYCNWIHERDELYLLLWGRLGYNPDLEDSFFDSRVPAFAEAWKAASKVIPTAFCAWSLGPDHRNHAPEMEWGGNTYEFLSREPFDSHVFMSSKEAIALDHTRGKDGRLRPWQAARRLDELSRKIKDTLPEPRDPRERERVIAIQMLGHLADYYSSRIQAAYHWATGDGSASLMETALAAWRALGDQDFYKPFTERLRMRTNEFHWKNELAKVEREARRVTEDPRQTLPGFEALPGSATLSWKSAGQQVECVVPSKGLTRAWLLKKPLPSSTFFHKVPMERKAEQFIASFECKNWGHMVAAEVEFNGHVRRIPCWEKSTPYLIIPSRQGPTPRFYSSEEALTYLKPEVLDREKHGPLLVCQRGWHFHRRFPASVQRKLLNAVNRGMTLIVMQQDFTSGRYPLTWLPDPPRLENKSAAVFDPRGALNLPKIEADGILWQTFVPTEGWEIHGNEGLVSRSFGKGKVWLLQARLMQNMHHISSANALLQLLKTGDAGKPRIIVDAGSEGAHYATSLFTDFMNAHEIPFLTLGEVIVAEQGMDSFEPVPGGVWDDTVLQGRGAELMKNYLEQKVLEKVSKPMPSSREGWEKEKHEVKREFLRCLGLDPTPPRTPLNARVTGVIKRSGYRLEKIVYKSRPGFPVTAHLYLPDPLPDERLPVIVNPHGHWRYKKAQKEVQTRAIFQALQGYMALVVDSPGYSFEGDALIERRYAGGHRDLRLTLGSFNTTGIYVWDLMRGLDYLETRPEADMTRVGLTGASGGGLATFAAFSAEDRFSCAVPVCYATSLETNFYNGCDCNHIPGSIQLGDRANILAVQAPKPIFVIGAQIDREFPPEGTRLTGEKLNAVWALYGKQEDTIWQIFEGGHDYNQEMREAMIGFFNLHLKGQGDGGPVPEPEIKTEPHESRELLCMPQIPEGLKSMQDIAAEKLSQVSPKSFEQVVALNGGLPGPVDLDFTIVQDRPGDDKGYYVTLTSEGGVTIPGILLLPQQEPKAGLVLVSEGGKTAALTSYPVESLRSQGYACLLIDVRGFGELPGLDPKLMSYLGTGDPFAMAWDAVRAAEALFRYTPRVGVIGRGSCGAQIALFAALMEPRIAFVTGLSGIRGYEDCLRADVPTFAIQTRAAHSAPLSHLRSLVKQPAVWSYMGADEPDLTTLDW